MQTHQIHNFSRKILQRSIFNRLKSYVEWQRKLRAGKRADMPRLGPVSINLDLTTACNYYCDHCIDLGMINNGNKLKPENIKACISYLRKRGLKSVIAIGGGEPVLYPHFVEMVSFLKLKGLQVGIATNGSNIAFIKRISPLLEMNDWIRLSLDAGENSTFQRIHSPKVKVTLDGILHGIKEVRRKYAQYQLGFSFLALSPDQLANNKNLMDNIKEIPLAAKKAKDSGFSYFSVKPFVSPFPSRFTEVQNKYTKRIRSAVGRAKRLEDETFRVLESLNLLALFEGFNNRLRKQTEVCHAQFFRWVVSPDGIFNCPTWRGFAKAYLLDTERKFSRKYCNELKNKLSERLDNFNSAKECAQVSCIYHDFNRFIERIIEGNGRVKNFIPIGDYGDYFF